MNIYLYKPPGMTRRQADVLELQRNSGNKHKASRNIETAFSALCLVEEKYRYVMMKMQESMQKGLP